jgi:hypothetical protein
MKGIPHGVFFFAKNEQFGTASTVVYVEVHSKGAGNWEPYPQQTRQVAAFQGKIGFGTFIAFYESD